MSISNAGGAILAKLVLAAAFSPCWGVAAAQTSVGADAPPDVGDAPVDEGDRQIYANGALDQFEVGVGRDEEFRWEGEVWAGTFKHRLWLRSEGLINRDGDVHDGRLDVLYDHPISTFFNLQAGLRLDIDSHPGRTWAAFGVEGHVPYLFKGWATVYVSDEGRSALALRASYDRLLSEHLILQPEIKLNLYSEDDPARLIGSGLSDLSADLRLRYEITDRLAPYVGVAYRRRFGDTAELTRAAGERADEARVVIGIRSWF